MLRIGERKLKLEQHMTATATEEGENTLMKLAGIFTCVLVENEYIYVWFFQMKRTRYLMIWPRCSKLLLDSEILLRHQTCCKIVTLDWIWKKKSTVAHLSFAFSYNTWKNVRFKWADVYFSTVLGKNTVMLLCLFDFFCVCGVLNLHLFEYKKKCCWKNFCFANKLFAISGVSLDFVVSVSTLHLR